MKEEDTTMRVEEVASPLPMIHAGSAMLSPRARAGSVSGGGGGGGSGAAAGSAVDPALLATYRQRMIDALQLAPAGVMPSEFDKWGDKDAVVLTMNKLLTDRQIALFTSASGDMFIKLVDEEHLADLSAEESLVLQEIEKTQSNGIWKKTLKTVTGLSEGEMKKCIKTLMTRKLIKEVKSVVSKFKKIYMLYDLEPAKELTGGPWYTEHQELDHDFVEGIRRKVLDELRVTPRTCSDLVAIVNRVHGTPLAWSVTDTPLRHEDISSILNTLLYDGMVERILPRTGSSEPQFKRCNAITTFNVLSKLPCGQCPVADVCTPDGVISPKTCVYLDKWLEF